MSSQVRLNNQVIVKTTQVFTTTGSVQTFTVPAGVFWIRFFLWGAGGIGQNSGENVNSAGGGGFVEGNLQTTPGTVFSIVVGARGRYYTTPTIANGGASGGGTGADGGGFSGIFSSTPGANTVIAIAGGGGGAGFNGNGYGGGGGYPSGGTAQGGSPGGSQSAGGGGSFPGSQFLGGVAGFGGDCCGGGGGGGWYGGGGGNNSQGGGGGSSTFTSIVINPIVSNGTNGSPTGVTPTPPGGTNSPVWISPYGSAGRTGLVVIGYNVASTLPLLRLNLNNTVIVNTTQAFTGTGTIQTFTVPAGVYWIRFFLWGAGGNGHGGQTRYLGSAGGSGAYVEGNFNTTPGTVFYVIVGRLSAGLANGGGSSGGPSGGGFTGIFSGSPATSNVVAIAGGGGGSGFNGFFWGLVSNGGGGGYPAGAAAYSTGGGTGGTQTAGGTPVSGAGAGSQLAGGTGVGGDNGGGGGGGGWWGGGGGNSQYGAGGGSSTYISSVINPITVNGIDGYTITTNGDYTPAANESSPYWVSPYGRSGNNGYAVIGYNLNSAPLTMTVGNVLASSGTSFTTDNTTYTFPANVSKVRAFVWGGGGGNRGGSGAFVAGDIVKGTMTTLTIYLNRGRGYYGPGGGVASGGFGAVYNSTNGYLLIAGAGGTGSGDRFGGGGGYLQGFQAGSATLPSSKIINRNYSNGGGGSQTEGGQGGYGNDAGNYISGQAGGYLQGGNGNLGSAAGQGGGGGYYGGGGGNGDANGGGFYTGNGAGGGGSSYVNTLFVRNYLGEDGKNGSASNVTPGGTSSPFYVSTYGVGASSGGGGNALVVIVPYIS